MSWLSKATGVHISPHGAHLSRPDPIGTIKDIAHNPLPLLGLAIPGVGSALGGALGSIGGAAGTALSGIPGLGALGGAVGGAIPDAAMGIGGGGGGLSGLLGGAGKFLAGNGGKNALGIAQGISGILDQKKSENYGKDALGAATGAYTAAAPLRAQGIQGLLNPTGTGRFAAPQRVAPVASFLKDPGNPYAT